MSLFRFIIADEESDQYSVIVVDAKSRTLAQEAMAGKVAKTEKVVSVNTQVNRQWEALEGQIEIRSDQLSLSDESDIRDGWEGDVVGADRAKINVWQPPMEGEPIQSPKPLMNAGALSEHMNAPPVVVVLYLITIVLLLGGLFGLSQVSYRYLDTVEVITVVAAMLSPALISWVISVAMNYLSGIHGYLKKISGS